MSQIFIYFCITYIQIYEITEGLKFPDEMLIARCLSCESYRLRSSYDGKQQSCSFWSNLGNNIMHSLLQFYKTLCDLLALRGLSCE